MTTVTTDEMCALVSARAKDRIRGSVRLEMPDLATFYVDETGAEISDRHANFIVTHEGAKSDDVLRLIDLARSKVSEAFGVDLELEIQIW